MTEEQDVEASCKLFLTLVRNKIGGEESREQVQRVCWGGGKGGRTSSRDICRVGQGHSGMGKAAKFSCFTALSAPVCLVSWGRQDTRRPAWAQTSGRRTPTPVTSPGWQFWAVDRPDIRKQTGVEAIWDGIMPVALPCLLRTWSAGWKGERTFSTWEAEMLFHWLMSVSSWNEALLGWSKDIVMEGIWWQDIRMNASDFRQRDLHILPRDRKVVCHLWSKFVYQMTANECFTHSRVYTFI